jgi:hypothetical protein
MSVLRLIPNVRQTAALEAPPSSAEVTAASFSASIVVGRPSPATPRGGQPSLNPLLDERPFKLRQRAEHMKEELALRSRGVHLLGERTKADAARLEIGHRRKQVRQGSSQPIQFPYNQAVAGLDEGERLGQACALAAVAAHPILEQVTFIDSGGKERVPLQIKSPAVAVGGNAHIADKHARKTLSDRFPHRGDSRRSRCMPNQRLGHFRDRLD